MAAMILALTALYASSPSALDVNRTLTLNALARTVLSRRGALALVIRLLARNANVLRRELSIRPMSNSSGYAVVSHFQPVNQASSVDCFYVYPTTSVDLTPNSDFFVDAQEIKITEAQAARYTAACRVFAPIYRQRFRRCSSPTSSPATCCPRLIADGHQHVADAPFGALMSATRSAPTSTPTTRAAASY